MNYKKVSLYDQRLGKVLTSNLAFKNVVNTKYIIKLQAKCENIHNCD